MSPGRLLYLAFYRPREHMESAIDRLLFADRDARMKDAASRLPACDAHVARFLPPVRFLTGARFAHQTAFCARSLFLVAGFLPRFEFFDDGSLEPQQVALLQSLFPGSRVISANESFATLEAQLPASRFPSLRFARERSPLMRKLLDMRAGATGPSLYLDSDMLFFSAPTRLIEWLRRPEGELHMAERNAGAYVDTAEKIASLVGARPAAGVNSGVLALDDASIDWEFLEHAASALGRERLAHKWAEQTLFALHFSRTSACPLDPTSYRVCNSRADLLGSPPVLRHYVHKSKMPYLAGEWRRPPLVP